MTEKISLEAAAQVMREAMRETVKRHSLLYLIQGGLMMLAARRYCSRPWPNLLAAQVELRYGQI